MNNRYVRCAIAVVMLLSLSRSNHAISKTLVAVWAHDDDIVAAAPVLARYAREGIQVYTIIATDGAQGSLHTSIPSGPELAQVRAAEARCAASALGIHPPVLLAFPDAKLGDYTDDRTRLYQLTERLQSELERLRPDALITWGPDGGGGHPDHRLVSSVLTQLVRAGAPGTTERLFYASLPAEGMRAVNPGRGVPRFTMPQQKYFTVRVPFASVDLEASLRAFACHKTQFPPDVMLRVSETLKATAMRELAMTPLLPAKMTNDLFDR